MEKSSFIFINPSNDFLHQNSKSFKITIDPFGKSLSLVIFPLVSLAEYMFEFI